MHSFPIVKQELIHLFQVLFVEAKRLNKKFDPRLIMTDFEPGIAKAIGREVQLSSELSKPFD